MHHRRVVVQPHKTSKRFTPKAIGEEKVYSAANQQKKNQLPSIKLRKQDYEDRNPGHAAAYNTSEAKEKSSRKYERSGKGKATTAAKHARDKNPGSTMNGRLQKRSC